MIPVAGILKLRDDTDIIKYTLTYYYNIGIKDFFIMLHFPSAELLAILQEVSHSIPDLNLRLLYHDKEGAGFNPANSDFLKILTDHAQDEGFKWIVGTDADEFLILKQHNKIQELISEYDCHDIISLLFNWTNYYLFADNLKKPFYKQMTHRTEWLKWTKSIGKFDSTMFYCQGLHAIGNTLPFQVISPLNQISIEPNIAFYAHFPFRSKDQFIQKNKMQIEKFEAVGYTNDWRKQEFQKDPLFFEKIWSQSIAEKTYPFLMDNDKPLEFRYSMVYDPLPFITRFERTQ